MLRHYKYVIIGAGPTGLGAAWRLKELGITDFIILERASHVGGLASSFKDDNGFIWDIGGHVQFSHYKYFDDLMEKAIPGNGWNHLQRESWAWMENSFVPYPVQNNIRHLSKESVWKCLEGLISAYQNPSFVKPKNFLDWINATFGEGLAEVFMVPYNKKVWAYVPELLDYNWIGERVAVTDLKKIVNNILFEKDEKSWGPNNTFQYPKVGGTGQIWKNIGSQIGEKYIDLNSDVIEINHESRKIATITGDLISYEYLLNTMPIDKLCRLVRPELPTNISETSLKLLHSSTNVVGIGLKGHVPEYLQTKCWMYFPENNCPFYRTTVFSNYSKENVPDSTLFWSLLTETSESKQKPVNRETIVEDTIQGCINTKLIQSQRDIVSIWKYSVDYGYPTPTLNRDQALKILIPELQKKGVYTRGRFGAWKYEVSNQDHSLMQGVEWVNHVCLDIPETTFFFPQTANANWGR